MRYKSHPSGGRSRSSRTKKQKLIKDLHPEGRRSQWETQLRRLTIGGTSNGVSILKKYRTFRPTKNGFGTDWKRNDNILEWLISFHNECRDQLPTTETSNGLMLINNEITTRWIMRQFMVSHKLIHFPFTFPSTTFDLNFSRSWTQGLLHSILSKFCVRVGFLFWVRFQIVRTFVLPEPLDGTVKHWTTIGVVFVTLDLQNLLFPWK